MSFSTSLTMIGIRYFTTIVQTRIDNDFPDPLTKYVTDVILAKTEFTYNKKKYGIIPLTGTDKRFVLGYFWKAYDHKITQLLEGEIKNSVIPGIEKLLFMIDTKDNLILIQSGSSLFNPDDVSKVLTRVCNEKAAKDGASVAFNFIVDSKSFWQEISAADGVFNLKFDLLPPNLFGSRLSANKMMEDAKEKYNISSMQVALTNKNGNLKVTKTEFESYRDYADLGGGSWELGLRKGKRNIRVKSSQKIAKANYNIGDSSPEYVQKSLKKIVNDLQALLRKFDDLKNR